MAMQKGHIAVIATLIAASSAHASGGAAKRVIADFEHGLPPGTEEKSFAGQTEYRIADLDNRRVLNAIARGSASGLVFPLRFDPAEWPWLEWRWMVNATVKKGDGRFKHGDDYAARVYVIFPHWMPLRTRSINYIWANRLAQGTAQPNTFTANAMMLAVRSGEDERGVWVAERRNLIDDYRRLFGEDPPDEAIVAVMTDTDQTEETVEAWYDDITLTR